MTLPTAANVTNPRAKGYDLKVGDYFFRSAASQQYPFTRQTSEAVPIRISTESNPEDMGEEFSRSMSRIDFTGGEGLEYAHSRNAGPESVTRFWDSENILITAPTEERLRVELQVELEEFQGGTRDPSTPVWHQEKLFMLDSSVVYRCDDPFAALPVTWTADPPDAGEGAQNIQGLLSDGEFLYAMGLSNGIHRRDSAGTWAHWSDLGSMQFAGAAKGRILVDSGSGILYEARSLATSIVILTGFKGNVVACIDLGPAIAVVAQGTLQNKTWIYLFAEEDGELVLANTITLHDERIEAMVSKYGKILYFATNDFYGGRLWSANLASDLSLQNSALLREFPNEGIDHFMVDMIIHEDAAYFGLVGAVSTEANIWKYLFATNAVVKEHHITGLTTGQFLELVIADQKLLITNATEGLRPAADYHATGWIIGPLADFFTDRDKEWLGVTPWFETLAVDDESIKVYYTTNPDALDDDQHADWTLLETYTTGDGGVEKTLAGINARWMAVKVELLASTDQDTTPKLIGYAQRAYPGTDNVRYLFPINVSDHIDRPNRQRIRVKGHGEALWQALKALEGTQVTVEVFRPAETTRSVIKRVSAPITVRADNGTSLQVALVETEGYVT